MDWLLYLLVFVFGYVTCQTFYFLSSARLSLILLRASHLIYISSMMKALENMAYARGIVLENMLKAEKNSVAISTFELRHEQDVRTLKDRSINLLIDIHPPFFKRMMEFKTWEEASNYIDTHKDVVFKFWEEDDR